METLRTPDECFASLPGYDFEPTYVTVDGIRIHTVDTGPRDGHPIVLLHGEPSWSFLYRHMIRPLAAAGYRVVAPDLVGFGRSDKPAKREDYTYARHLNWLSGALDALDLGQSTLFCQDWGGLLGLRLLAETPARFARVVAANTFLPTGREPMPEAFHTWRKHSQTVETFDIGRVIDHGTATTLAPEVIAAYNAPFPEERYKEGARQFPMLVPATPDAPGAAENQAAWLGLMKLETPFLTAFADKDPITRGADKFLQRLIPGAKGQAHCTVENAGHFLQEDQGKTLADIVLRFIAATPQ
ncbi:MAG: haloalkane dehalogenase [Myxococcota bacterium]